MRNDTKQLIWEQLLRLLEQKKLEDITVKCLADSCEISRQTFYYHFQSTMDVLSWGTKQIVDQGLAESQRAPDLRESIRIFVDRIVQNKNVICKLLESSHRAECERIFMDGVGTYLQQLFWKKWPNANLSVSDVSVFLDFHAYGLVGLLLKHCELETNVGHLLDQICRLLTGEMREQISCM